MRVTTNAERERKTHTQAKKKFEMGRKKKHDGFLGEVWRIIGAKNLQKQGTKVNRAIHSRSVITALENFRLKVLCEDFAHSSSSFKPF